MKTPASAALPYIQQIPGAEGGYYNPYISTGQQANQNLFNAGNQLMNNPAGMYNNIASGYQMSPYAQNQINQQMNAINNTAAAGGYIGTPYNQQQVASMVQGITSKDENQYINSVIGLYHMGLLDEQDLNNLGFQASGKMADVTGNTLNEEGGLAYANQSQKNAMHRNRMSNILGLGGSALGFGASLLGDMGGPRWTNPDTGSMFNPMRGF